jgi:hypothetical protein
MELPTSDPLRKEKFDGYSTEKMLGHAARIRDERRFNDFPIIDSDAHHYEAESIAEIAEFIDDESIRQEARSNPRFLLSGGGTRQPMGGRITRYPLRPLEQTPSDNKHRDIHLTHRFMDAMGTDYSVLFPTGLLSRIAQDGSHPVPCLFALADRKDRQGLGPGKGPGAVAVRCTG